MEHNLNLKNRNDLVISGVDHIYNFNDKKIEIRTVAGDMTINGENMDMSKLSIDEKIITVTGQINSIGYTKDKKSQENFFKKVFK